MLLFGTCKDAQMSEVESGSIGAANACPFRKGSVPWPLVTCPSLSVSLRGEFRC